MRNFTLSLLLLALLALCVPALADGPSDAARDILIAVAGTEGAAPMGFPAHATSLLTEDGAAALILMLRPQRSTAMSAQSVSLAALAKAAKEIPDLGGLLEALLAQTAAYDAGAGGYACGALVVHNGGLYIAHVNTFSDPVTTTEPDASSNQWREVKPDARVYDDLAWSNNETFESGDVVLRNGAYYLYTGFSLEGPRDFVDSLFDKYFVPLS